VYAARPDEAPTPTPAPPQAIDKSLAEILDKKIDVIYRREYLCEVLDDLDKRVGLRSAYPISIGRAMLTFESKYVSVKEVLEKLVAKGFNLEFNNKTAVFWKSGDDKAFAALEKKLKDGDAHARCEAACDLAYTGSKRACSLLLTVLNDEDASVRMWAIFSLGNFRDTLIYASPPSDLAERLLKDLPPSGEYLAAVARLLGATHSKITEGKLLEITDGNDTPAREAAAEALRTYHSKDVVTALIKHIGDEDQVTRRNIANTLGEIGDEQAIKPLFAFLDRTFFLTEFEAECAAKFGWEKINVEIRRGLATQNVVTRKNMALVLAYVRGNGREEAYAELVALLKDPDSGVRETAAYAFYYADNPDAVETLINVIEKEPESSAKKKAVDSLARLRTERSTQWILEHYKGCEKSDKSYYIRSLGATRDERALDVLVEAMKCGDLLNTAMVVLGLTEDRSQRAFDYVAASLNDVKEGPRWHSTIGLTRFRDPRAINSLIAFLDHSSSKWKPAVAASCARDYLFEASLSDRERIKIALDAYNAQLQSKNSPPNPSSKSDF